MKINYSDEQWFQVRQFSTIYDNLYTSRENLIKLPVSLKNIRTACELAFNKIKVEETRNILVAIGETGCGKSTLLNSLILGPDKLKKTKLE